MRNTFVLGLFAAEFCLAGCGAMVTSQGPSTGSYARGRASTELGDKKGDYSRLTLAVVPSARTTSGTGPRPGTTFLLPDFWLGAMESSMGRYFKRVVKVDSVKDAKAVGADLIAEIDCVSKVTTWTNSGQIELQAAVTASNGESVDTIYGSNDLARQSIFAVNSTQKIDAEAQQDFDHSLLYSKKLVDFAENYQPGAAAPAPADAGPKAAPKSDVDSPGYKKSARPNDFALVIGIEKYSNDLPDAQFAERDARVMREHLVALGYPERNIVSLVGSKAGKAAFIKNVETWLPLNVGEGSTVFVYFSGHGAPDPATGQAYLVPWDGDPEFLKDTAYPAKRLYEKLNALKAKRVIVAMDACFSGRGGHSVLAKGARPLVSVADMGDVGSGKVIAFSAAGGDQISGTMEDQGHGAFTYYFLKGLNGEAADSSGHVTAKSLYDYLSPNVQDAARRHGRAQTPQLSPALSEGQSEIILR